MALSASLKATAWNLEMGWPNCSPFLGILQGRIIGTLGAPQSHSGDGEPAAVQRLEHLVKTVTLLA
jgi:hypothetical protein